MIIGVICEGPTDFHAIKEFFGAALSADGVEAVFKGVFPERDCTRSEGGWANVLLWLKNNSPSERVQSYFSGGLFAEPLTAERMQGLLIQLDTDILDNDSFRAFVLENYEIVVADVNDPNERADELSRVLNAALGVNELSQADAKKHVLCPAVESTETWCVAAFKRQPVNVEALQGQDLTQHFMEALERFEGKNPEENYANCNKNVERRARYCQSHGRFWGRIVRSSPHFASTLFHLRAL